MGAASLEGEPHPLADGSDVADRAQEQGTWWSWTQGGLVGCPERGNGVGGENYGKE